MLKTQNIGPAHSMFNHNVSRGTQILVKSESGVVVAHFFGLQAKILANDFVVQQNKKLEKVGQKQLARKIASKGNSNNIMFWDSETFDVLRLECPDVEVTVKLWSKTGFTGEFKATVNNCFNILPELPNCIISSVELGK